MPVRAGKRPAQDRAVGRAELGSLDLVAQHLDLMTEHGDLDIFGVLATEASERHADEPACHEVEEGQSHRRVIPLTPSSLLSQSRCGWAPAAVSASTSGTLWDAFKLQEGVESQLIGG
jgi:hypothetical protein